jgi:hypothetical protein
VQQPQNSTIKEESLTQTSTSQSSSISIKKYLNPLAKARGY